MTRLIALDQVAEWPVSVAAVGVLHGGGLSTIGPIEAVLPWASVTKPVTALAVLVAVEEGTLDLDLELDPARLGQAPGETGTGTGTGTGAAAGVAARPPGVTVAHLLAHASGLATDRPVLLDRPGAVRRYSNAGFRILGDVLAERSGLTVDTYLREAVLEPLGMGETRLEGGPDAGLRGPLRDLLALTAELARPTLVSAGTHRVMTTVAYPELAGVLPGYGHFSPCPWGLGVEIRGGKRPHWTGAANTPATYGHFGRAGSFLWVDPGAGVAAAGLADAAFGPWAQRAWPALADAVLDEVSGPAGREAADPA